MRDGQKTTGQGARLAIRPRLEYKSWMISLLLPVLVHALSFEVVGPCRAAPEFRVEHELVMPATVGSASVEILDRHQIPYIGSELGFNSILNTPVDRDAIEFPAPDEIRAYGWCFELNGKQPMNMPHEIALNGSEHLRWFYAFALYRKGEWVSYCTPAHTIKPAKLCPGGL